jgi:transketolase
VRNAFAKEIERLAAVNDRLVLLSGDIGNRLFDSYKARFGNRFYNCGVAEANMTSMAAGMAMSGLRPVTYTITPFNTSRCYEQIKIDICYHNQPVIVVGVGAGLSYAGLGTTHHSFEDIAILRALPNMTVVCPCDAVEVKLALEAALDLNQPVYLRLGKKNEPLVHLSEPDFKIGRGIWISEGDRVCLLGCGTILPEVCDAADQLNKKGISTGVVSMHTVKPLDGALLNQVFSHFDLVCTIEEHSLIGGFGSSVAEWMTDHLSECRPLLRFGIKDAFLHGTGDTQNARKMTNLTADHMVASVEHKLKR